MSNEQQRPLDDLEFEFDFRDVKDVKKHIESFGVGAGFYHVVCTKVQKRTVGDKPVLEFSFSIQAGTNPSFAGQTHRETVWLTDNDMSRKRQQNLAMRAGLIGQEAAGTTVRKTWAAMTGKHYVIELRERSYKDKQTGEDKQSSEISRDGLWLVTDPEVAAVPKNVNALAQDGILLPPIPPGAVLPKSKSGTAQGEAGNGTATAGQTQQAGGGWKEF